MCPEVFVSSCIIVEFNIKCPTRWKLKRKLDQQRDIHV